VNAVSSIRRQLSETDIIEYRQRVASLKPEDLRGKDKHIAATINGCGTALYGKRDFEPDGSFVTTKWFVAFFMPVFPAASMRVKVVKNGWLRYNSYLLRHKQRPRLKQVAYVYSYLLLLVVAATSVAFLPKTATAVLLAAVLQLPWLLRRLARAGIVSPPRPL
jgi:hypothetical protein